MSVTVIENGRTQIICPNCWGGDHAHCILIGCDCDCNYEDEPFYDVNENETFEKDGYA